MTNKHWMESDDTAQKRIDQAQRLKEQAKTGGIKFDVYLPPGLAEWILGLVEDGVFIDPSEAVFVYMCRAHDIAAGGLEGEVEKLIIQDRIDRDDGTRYTTDEVMQHLRELDERRTEPVTWEKIKQPDEPDGEAQ